MIRRAVDDVARLTGPVLAEVSGTGTLGSDQAKVALVQSPDLNMIRTLLAADPAVRRAMERVEQFPTWTPHVTLAYAGPAPSVDRLPPIIEFDRLAVWCGDQDRTEYKLAVPIVATAREHDDQPHLAYAANSLSDPGMLAAGFACPVVDPDDPHSIAVAIRHGDNYPAARPIIVKTLRGGGVGHLLEALDWPELRELSWEDADGTTWRAATQDDLGRLPQPEEELDPVPAATYTDRDFWTALGRGPDLGLDQGPGRDSVAESLIERTRRVNRERGFGRSARGDGLSRRQRAGSSPSSG